MRKLSLAAAIVSGLALAACSTAQLATINDVISKVQGASVAACSFLPTANTVAAILSGFIPGASAIEQVAADTAAKICVAVTPKVAPSGAASALRAPRNPMVNGVPIKGRFVR